MKYIAIFHANLNYAYNLKYCNNPDEIFQKMPDAEEKLVSLIEAVRKFVDKVDEALPEAVHPLRKTIVDSALELADQLVTTQYEFLRSIVRSADRALSKPHDPKD